MEEHVYNDQGAEIQSFTYNSLDPTSKCYTENESDESGQVLATFDECGEHKTAFEYERDGVRVKTERLPNGSKRSFGRTRDGSVSAVTHSAEAGEENSTTQASTLGVVTELRSGNNTVQYQYDAKRRVEKVALNGTESYLTYAYSEDSAGQETVTATLKDGITETRVQDVHGNMRSISRKHGNAQQSVTNTYNEDGQLTAIADSVSGKTVLEYDGNGNVTSAAVYRAGNAAVPEATETYTYDGTGEMPVSKTVTVGNTSHTYRFSYRTTADKALASITIHDGADTGTATGEGTESNTGYVVEPAFDLLGRYVGRTTRIGTEVIAKEKITYLKSGDHATSLPSTVRFIKSDGTQTTMQYRYDEMGNICEMAENGKLVCRCEYDALGRLTREDHVPFGKTTVWAYDHNGNILMKREYALTVAATNQLHMLNSMEKLYDYQDGTDRLLHYGEENFVYDAIGNPTTYRGKQAEWHWGRQLTKLGDVSFTYDASGRRMSKRKDETINFTYDANGNLIRQSNGLEFLYDHLGVFAVKYGNSTYFYSKDARQNIVALLDSTGAVVVKYRYDAWGNCQTTVLHADANAIAELNPFRYRSYYFDTETGLYFLKTRYYDPELGRFMTIDDIAYLDPETVNGLNLYAYCGNNPVMGYDPDGASDRNALLKFFLGMGMALGLAVIAIVSIGSAGIIPVFMGAVLGATASFLSQGIGNVLSGNNFFDNIDPVSIIMGGLAGAAFGGGTGGIWGAAGIGALANAGSAALHGKSWKQIGLSAVVGAAAAGAGYGIGRLISNKIYATNNLKFRDFYQLTCLDGGTLRSALTAFKASWYTFLPSVFTGITRALLKYLGKKGSDLL